MAETKQPLRGSTKAERMTALHLAKHGWPNTADVDSGPLVVAMKCSGAIKVGDVVGFHTVAGQVVIGTSITTTVMGVCVGGVENGFHAIYGASALGHSFADGSVIFVAIAGITFVPAEGTIAIGDQLIPGTSTAGTAKAGTTAGAIVGKAMTASSASSTIMVLIGRS